MVVVCGIRHKLMGLKGLVMVLEYEQGSSCEAYYYCLNNKF